jgi:hypothetical protein
MNLFNLRILVFEYSIEGTKFYMCTGIKYSPKVSKSGSRKENAIM